MDNGQFVIKVILVLAFAAFAVFLMLPGRGVRHAAIRRLVMVGLLAVTVLAVVFPSVVTEVAHFVGVGRGTDLLLYGLIVVFIGNSILVQRRYRNTERQITELARQIAILQAPAPASVGTSADRAGRTPGRHHGQLSGRSPRIGRMRTLITGGAGYIGSHVVRLLRNRGDSVVVVDDLSTGFADRLGGARLVRLDLASDTAPALIEAVLARGAHRRGPPLRRTQAGPRIGAAAGLVLRAERRRPGQSPARDGVRRRLQTRLLVVRGGLRRCRGGCGRRVRADASGESVRTDQAHRRTAHRRCGDRIRSLRGQSPLLQRGRRGLARAGRSRDPQPRADGLRAHRRRVCRR